ncbi:killer cell lectin-like receptor subfamily F member 2 [Ranitomeya imitator]|uniref:killer cell lectin-like receptor subfamily F member 2 n=1 Tax=Ranitomeya imitator TaxID=111125 RepID=UPI0037E94BAE
MGADLLVIKNQEEKGFIERTLQQRVNDTYWIGLHRDGDAWRWVDEEYYNSSLFKFKVQSPESCTLMTKSGYYQDDCNRKYGTICLKNAAKIDLS